MSARERRKGAVAEREVIGLLRLMGVDARRNLMQTREGGFDLEGLPYAVEVKRQERLALPAWLSQAKAQTTKEHPLAVVIFRRSREPWRVLIEMNLEQFAEHIKGGRWP